MPPSLILLELKLEKILISDVLEYDRPKEEVLQVSFHTCTLGP